MGGREAFTPAPALYPLTRAEDELVGGQGPVITANGHKVVLGARLDAPHPAIPLRDLGQEHTVARVQLDRPGRNTQMWGGEEGWDCTVCCISPPPTALAFPFAAVPCALSALLVRAADGEVLPVAEVGD